MNIFDDYYTNLCTVWLRIGYDNNTQLYIHELFYELIITVKLISYQYSF